MGYTYPLRSDWSTEEIITVIAFYEIIEKIYEEGVVREKVMDAYLLFKKIVPSKSEEKALFKEFEEVSGYDTYRAVKAAKEGEIGQLIKGT